MYTGFYGSARMKFVPAIPFAPVILAEKDTDERRFFSMSGIILTPCSNSDALYSS